MMRPSRARRGLTLLETLVTAAVLILGIGVVASTVVSIVRLNRRNLAQAQAYTIAEWNLERIALIGCATPLTPGDDPCAAIKAMDGRTSSLFWTASGIPSTTAPAGPEPARPYWVSVDVDPPFEGNEKGAPALERDIMGASETITLNNTLNVRVTVSWQDELSRNDTHAVALQTRVGL